ncbi:MAG: radical SAM protein [Pseudomonadota bacterium]
MKIILIQPPIQDFYDTKIRLQPLGLAYLKASINKFHSEVEVKIKDYHAGFKRQTISYPKELSYLKDYYKYPDKSHFSSFYQYYHFGASFEFIATDIESEKPDLVAISSSFSPYYKEVLKCAEVIKSKLNVPIVLGGSHASSMPEMMLENKNIDFIIIGEGERPIVELIKALTENRDIAQVPSLVFKQEDKIIYNKLQENYDINKLAIPDFNDLNPQNYLYDGKPLSFIITSRGCPFKCSFCSINKVFGKNYRRRNNESIIEEMLLRYETGIRVFDFEDDNLSFHKTEFSKLCKLIISTFTRKDIQLLAMNGISYQLLDKEILGLMKEAGFTHLNISLVSCDLSTQDKTKRSLDLKKYESVVKEAFLLGLKTVSYQILGLPNESLETMIDTLIYQSQNPVLIGSSMYYQTPGSHLSGGIEKSSLSDVYKSRLTTMAIETDLFKREDIYTLFIITRIINFIKSLETDQKEISIQKALNLLENKDLRSKTSVEILNLLLSGKGFFAYTKEGQKIQNKFDNNLFLKIWMQLSYIKTQKGIIILKNSIIS